MPKVTLENVHAAEARMLAAKKGVGTAKKGDKVDAYRKAADDLTSVRRAYREQEEQAGTRTGYVSGDAAN